MPTPQEVQAAINNNMANRMAIVQNAMPMMQPLQTQTIATLSASNNVLTFQPRLTGLIVGFLVEVNLTYTNAGANIGNRTNGGALNAVSRIAFTDLNNYTRINTNGYHLGLLNNVKNARAFGGAVAPNLPYNVGNVWTVNSLASTIAAGGGTAALRQFYYVPVAYSREDLTGAIYAQVVNATMQLQITLNAAPGSVATDPLFKVYSGLVAASDVTATNVTVKVTTLYYNTATPRGGNFPLPMIDLARSYLVQDQIANMTVVANSDCAAPYANARTFYSTFAVYDNNGVFNTGSDVTYFKLQYANLLAQFELNPQTIALLARNAVGFDMPPGVYYFDHRAYPISTQAWGNCELDINPASVTAGAFLGTWYEMVAQENTIIQASSL